MSDKNFKVKNGLTIQGTTDTLITADNSGGISLDGTVTADSFVGDGSGLTGISSYEAPTLGSTSIASGATVSTIAGLTLSNPSLYTASTNEASASSVSAEFGTGKVPGGLGVRTVGGVKRYFIPSQYLPNPDFLYSVPIGSDVTVYTFPCNDGVCGFYTQFLKTTSVYDGNSFVVTNYDGSTAYDDNFSTASTASLELSFVYSGTQAAVTVPSVNLRDLDKDTPGSLYQLIKTKKIVLEKFEGNPNSTCDTVTGSWTVPSGVYSLDITLIGGGGAGGTAFASANAGNASTSANNSYGTNGVDSTITYNGVTYTAAGGAQGEAKSISETGSTWDGAFTGGSESGGGLNTTSGNRKPGRGGRGAFSYAQAFTSGYDSNDNGLTLRTSRVTVQGGPGFDGEEKHITLPVVPGSTMSYTIGQNGGDGCNWGDSTSNPGAMYIRYIR
jgi:hypothetical protein